MRREVNDIGDDWAGTKETGIYLHLSILGVYEYDEAKEGLEQTEFGASCE